MASGIPSVAFSVKRHEPKLVEPEKPTPQELKPLSDIEDSEGFRFHVPMIMFYRNNSVLKGKDPVKVIREGLAKALVFYYPLAGRLVEGPNRKLLLDCTGQGVLFVEAEADASLEHIGDAIQPPCPYLQQLLHDVPGSSGILGCPLLLIQVTRFVCGGFSLATRLNHTVSDAFGLVQFLNAVGELARGATSPSITPTWQREILNARDPPRVTCKHVEYEEDEGETRPTSMNMSEEDDNNNNMVHSSFFFGQKEISALRSHLPPQDLKSFTTTFELLTACLWKCRTAAFRPNPDETIRISCPVNARAKHVLNIPRGFYGNAFAFPAAVSKAGDLCKRPLTYAVELVKKAKAQMSEEYMRSLADYSVINGRPMFVAAGNYIVSDNTRIGFEEVDFGWGRAVYGGPASAVSLISFHVNFKKRNGEDGRLVTICLPSPAMERFKQELEKMISLPYSSCP